jgi:hypothetical protein
MNQPTPSRLNPSIQGQSFRSVTALPGKVDNEILKELYQINPSLSVTQSPPLLDGQPISSSGIYGRSRIWQYTNYTVDVDNTCGQAAVATILTNYEILREDPGESVLADIYNRFPPDLPLGKGTSPGRMQSSLREGWRVDSKWIGGEDELKKWISNRYLVILLLDVGRIPKIWEGNWGMHWTVAFAYDDENIYLTNWPDNGRCSWSSLSRAWWSDNPLDPIRLTGLAGQFMLTWHNK